MPLRFVRYYNSHRWTGIYFPSTVGVFNLYSNVGPNWTTSYDRVIRFSDSVLYPTVYAYRPDGRTLLFKLSNGQFVADADSADRVVRLTDGSGNPVGWHYTIASSEEVETYDDSGKLLSIANRAGALQTLSYDSAGRLATVSDSFGRTLTLAYDANGRLGSLTDPDGEVYTYQYNSATDMSSVAYPDGSSRTYVYNESANTSGGLFPFAMTGIVDEAGCTLRHVPVQHQRAGDIHGARRRSRQIHDHVSGSTDPAASDCY
jgi:YD repeat-containing protein